MSYNLFLDDLRQVKDVSSWIELPLVSWAIVRSYKEFTDYIQQNGVPAIVSFDADLAEEHYGVNWEEADRDGNFEKLNNSLRQKTGYDAAKFLVSYCLDKKLPLPQYYVHSMNVTAKKHIEMLMERYRPIAEKNRKK